VTDPTVRLHDVSVDGDLGGDRDSVLAAVERGVEAATRAGPLTPDAVRAAVSAAVSASRQP
jgi:hypothetical protein